MNIRSFLLISIFTAISYLVVDGATPRTFAPSASVSINYGTLSTVFPSLYRRASTSSSSSSSSISTSHDSQPSTSSSSPSSTSTSSSSGTSVITASDVSASNEIISSSTNNSIHQQVSVVTEYVTIQPTTYVTTIFQYTSLASTIAAQSGIASLVPQTYTPYGGVKALIGILVGVVVGSVFLLAIVMVIARIWGPRLLANKDQNNNNEDLDSNLVSKDSEGTPQITYASNF
ncbi:Schizosaccharomyces specific protein [Schizosaccharomyces pombe]|uniref:Uncharacterized protein C16G5.06 n=1 Tax=Schizosaccharomyces pombe (strain 972 / ATCC 24843) TaxID=284812 RepID=YH76_SCHPO|nr:uncharacterized protein SPBC16G5.06 [Schizosaccharomyces pombe]O60120.1 RecName: Full=Uncharacterized protein C16G5.06; Flags: Precursor [Schizosaccharomyces pombe 972h-]CAA19026.1 sequence orphan [Schizosaccharomyces pombe]|eukprot:NP_596755.1 uncharacterized protein SPBC16G5.06 [Schizosaccharomyces pombe]